MYSPASGFEFPLFPRLPTTYYSKTVIIIFVLNNRYTRYAEKSEPEALRGEDNFELSSHTNRWKRIPDELRPVIFLFLFSTVSFTTIDQIIQCFFFLPMQLIFITDNRICTVLVYRIRRKIPRHQIWLFFHGIYALTPTNQPTCITWSNNLWIITIVRLFTRQISQIHWEITRQLQ